MISFDTLTLAKKASASKTKILTLNVALTEQDLLEKLKENIGYECSGFFYNADQNEYCEFEGLYYGITMGSEIVHFGYCHIRGIHTSSYNVDYYIDDEDGSLWHVKKPEDYLYNILGDKDISSIGDGTITGAILALSQRS